MSLDRFDTQHKLVCNLLVGISFRDQLEDFHFAGRESAQFSDLLPLSTLVGWGCWNRGRSISSNQRSGESRIEKSSALGYGCNGHMQVSRRSLFDQIPGCPGSQCLKKIFLALMHRQDQNIDLWQTRTNLFAGFQTVHIGHTDIQDNHVWLQSQSLGDGLSACACLSHNLDPWLQT